MTSDLSVEFPADYTQWLFDNGAMLVFLDLPAGSEFGIDYNYYETGAQFKGVKMIPPGIHFIYYR
jgi:A1 cistron-splicing factor AAR2